MRNSTFKSGKNRLNPLRFNTKWHCLLLPLLLLGLLVTQKAAAQFSTPVMDSNFDGGSTYPNSYTSGATTWHMTWDNNQLFVFLQNDNQSEPVTLYLDVDPITPVNGGSDANGTLVGLDYDGYTTRPNLPFRADVAIYAHNGYRELFRRDGANGWTSLGGGGSGIRGDGTSDYTGGHANGQYATHDNGNGNGTDDRREFAIAWSRLLGTINGGNRPASFNWMGYVAYGNGMYAQVPIENYSGGAVSANANSITRYFTVSSTANGTSTNPFGRNSYTHPITATNNFFGAIAVWDFTMNSPGQQMARLNSGGDWNIGGNLIVNAGTLYFGSGGSGYGTTQVSGNLNLSGGTLHMDQTNKSLDVLGNISISNAASLILSATAGGDIKTQGNWTRANTATFNPNGRAVFFNGNTTQILTVTGGGTETFNYLNSGGSGTLQLATGTDATVNTANGVTLASSHTTSTLDLNGQTFAITGGGNLSLASGNRKITSSLANGTFSVATSSLAIANTGTLELDASTTLLLQTGLDFGAGNPTTINGTLQLNLNAFVNVNAPKYGPSSLLRYNSGSNYERRIEWNSNIGGTYGVPHNVIVSNNTTLNYPFGTPGALGMTGDLTIDSGSKLFMDYGALNSNGPLTVMGNMVAAGDMTLGTLAGNDLKIGGNITFSTGYTFDAKNRAVFFIKDGLQTITAPALAPPSFHYVVFQPSSGSTTLQLQTDLAITAPVAGNVISFHSANDVFDLNGKTLTLGTPGSTNLINGTGSFKGSNTAALTLLGNGSIGTLHFTSGGQSLGNLTVDRQDNAIAATLGTPLTINTLLTLNKGLVDLGSSTMSLNLNTLATSNAGSYIIADESGSSGRLRKRVGATDRKFEFPIGDKMDSANGSQYAPATVEFTAGSFTTAYMTLSVNDSKHPEIQADDDYITRYWRLTTTGVTGSAAFSFSGTYHPSDVEGIESNSISGSWNGNQWTEGTTIGSPANTLNIDISTDATTGFFNDMTAGHPLGTPKIKVMGNNNTIISGDTTPSPADFTDFGNSLATRSSTFLIQNLPTATRILNLSSVLISGTDASDFAITTTPAPSVVAGATTYLVIKCTPSQPGLRTATVIITNNDPDNSAYTFEIQGQGVDYTECSYGNEEIIAQQDFEDSPATPTWGFTTPLPSGASIAGGTAYGKTGDNGATATSDKYIGAKSLQVNNANAEIIWDAIDTSNLSDVNVSIRVGAFSVGSNGNGMDATVDTIRVALSTDGGTTWSDEITVNGNNEAKWNFTTGTGIGTTVYDGNGIVEEALRPASGGYRTTDGYSTLKINNLPLVSNLRMKIILTNNHANEIWAIDNIELKAKRKETKTWNGTAWSGDGNPPTTAQIALIDGDYDTNSTGIGFQGCECEVKPDKTLTIAAGHTIDIQSNFTNNGTTLFEDSASLLQHNQTALNTGNISIKRNTSPVFRYDFTYWSSPLTHDSHFKLGNDSISLSPATLSDKFYKWNHDAEPAAWQIIPHGDEVMNPATGYIVRAPQDFDIEGQPEAEAKIYTATFVGKPNNGVVQHDVTGAADPNDDKWNLLGNPYPSAINIETFLASNQDFLDGTIYLWTHNTQVEATGTGTYQYSPDDYAAYNFSGALATTSAATSGGSEPTAFIATGQAFFVKGLDTGTISFNNSMRVGGNNSQFFKPTPTEPLNNWELTGKHRIWLNLTGENAFNQTLVGYIQNATNGLDWGYDGDHFGGNKVSLYSIVGNKNLAIQGRTLPFSNQDQIQLGYKTTLNGTLKISIDHYDGLFEGQDIYLEDLILNTIHNLKTSDYTFTTVPGTFNNRFVLRYIPQETLTNPETENILASVIILKDKKELRIKSAPENIQAITVYDILGKTIFYQDKINSNHFTATDITCNTQTLIVKVRLANNTIATKKVIY